MTVSSAFQWCWRAYLLLLAYSVLGAVARPIHAPFLSQRPQHICGTDLPKTLEDLCVFHQGYFSPRSVPSSDADPSVGADNESGTQAESPKRGSLTDECCVKGCTYEYLSSYCGVVRNQTMVLAETQLNKVQEWSNNVTEEYNDVYSDLITPTVPLNRPEIYYDGEYSDQESLTLLPTYTSPEYPNDLLVLRL